MAVGVDQIFQRNALRRIHLGIVIFEGALKTVTCQHRFARQRGFGADPAMAGKMLRRVFQPIAIEGQQVIQRQPRAQLQPLGQPGAVKRQQEGQRPHQMRRDAHQAQPLAQAFAHQ